MCTYIKSPQGTLYLTVLLVNYTSIKLKYKLINKQTNGSEGRIGSKGLFDLQYLT